MSVCFGIDITNSFSVVKEPYKENPMKRGHLKKSFCLSTFKQT